jgi:hypothetical protein
MKRKLIILLALTVAMVGITACGKTETEPTEVVETTEVVTEDIEDTEDATYQAGISTTSSSSTSSDGNEGSTTVATTTIKESESWPEYKETMDYYVENGMMPEARAYMLNPDIYGTETYGKSTSDFETNAIGSGINMAEYTDVLSLTTTKGYGIEAWYYKETGTVQFIYCGEVDPSGSWFLDEASFDPILEVCGDDAGGALNLTHQQKIDLLGEPSMTAEEVIAALGY